MSFWTEMRGNKSAEKAEEYYRCQQPSSSPLYAGERLGEGLRFEADLRFDAVRRRSDKPLTPALSPEYRGEGVRLFR
jgi:hypothetical protein